MHLIEKMKDRIKQIMESQHMTQQVFAEFLGIAPATLSGIFTERTKPTLNTVEAIKKKLPTLSTDWLMFGKEPMYLDHTAQIDENSTSNASQTDSALQGSLFDFSTPPSTPQGSTRPVQNSTGVKPTRLEMGFSDMNNFDKQPRKVTEIRVFYDDQTWESFIPAKK